MNQYKAKAFKEKSFEWIFLLTACVSIISVLVICLFLLSKGVPAISEIGLLNFLTGTDWKPTASTPSFGIAPMIIGSLYITLGAVIIGVPIGILTAVFITKYCNEKLYKFIKPMINLLAGIPSIVYGFFGMTVLVPFIRDIFSNIYAVTKLKMFATNGQSILTASLLLGFMILPTIINISEASLKAVPSFYYEGSRALGATHERSIFKVMLPSAKSGIFASIVLGVGRAIGETMAVIMVAGNQPRITGNILSGIRTMTANVVLEMGYATDLHADALVATGVVLFVFILVINLVFAILNKKGGK